jgi:hypothetical protein
MKDDLTSCAVTVTNINEHKAPSFHWIDNDIEIKNISP